MTGQNSCQPTNQNYKMSIWELIKEIFQPNLRTIQHAFFLFLCSLSHRFKWALTQSVLQPSNKNNTWLVMVSVNNWSNVCPSTYILALLLNSHKRTRNQTLMISFFLNTVETLKVKNKEKRQKKGLPWTAAGYQSCTEPLSNTKPSATAFSRCSIMSHAE